MQELLNNNVIVTYREGLTIKKISGILTQIDQVFIQIETHSNTILLNPSNIIAVIKNDNK